jgi:hypothetical protein
VFSVPAAAAWSNRTPARMNVAGPLLVAGLVAVGSLLHSAARFRPAPASRGEGRSQQSGDRRSLSSGESRTGGCRVGLRAIRAAMDHLARVFPFPRTAPVLHDPDGPLLHLHTQPAGEVPWAL